MNTNQLVQKLRRWARARDVEFVVSKHEGKGSHRTIYLGSHKTTIPWTTNDLTTGTLRGVLKQLEVDDLLGPSQTTNK